MNLEFVPEQEDVIDGFAEMLRRVCETDRLDERQTGEIWEKLSGAGWTEIGAQIETGDLDIGTALGIFEAAGHHLLGEQFTTGSYLVPAIATYVEDSAQRERLRDRLKSQPAVLLGNGRGSVIPIADDQSSYVFGLDSNSLLCEVRRAGEDLNILRVWGGDFTINSRVAGLSPTVGRVELNAGTWEEFALRVPSGCLERVERTALILHSAAMVGCGREIVTKTRDYTLSREQFNTKIASFQALKHMMADAVTGLEVAWSSLLYAAAAGDAEVLGALSARILSVESAMLAARTGAQLHGGIGYTNEASLHFYLKVVLDGAQRFSTVDEFAEEAGRELIRRHANAA